MPLFHRDTILRARAGAYYASLHELPEFTTALDELAAALPATLVTRDNLSRNERHLIAAFVTLWHLPKGEGPDDVFWSVWEERQGEPLRLTVASGGGWVTDLVEPSIHPKVPHKFEYDPILRSHAWLVEQADAIAADVRSSIIAQGVALEMQVKEHGWQERPGYMGEADLLRLARRLRRRTVEGKSWAAIAESERSDSDTHVSRSAVIRTVTDWANALDIPLR